MTDLLYGAHVQGGQDMVRGLRHAIGTGATAAQVFPGNPLSYEVCKRFTHEREMRALVDQLDLTVHASYFIILTQPPGEKRTKSIEAAVKTLRWAEDIGAKRVVVHPGSTRDPKWEDYAVDWLYTVWREYDGTVDLLLETMPGQTSLGKSFTELLRLCFHSQLGICVDLTHSWSAGLTIGELSELGPKGVDKAIRACHFNVPNPGVKQGSGIDKHSVGFHQTDWTYHEIERLWRAFNRVPCILEGTPCPERDYDLLRSWS